MKTISFFRYSYKFYKTEAGQPVVDAMIEDKFVQRLFITAEGGNDLYTDLRKYQRKLLDSHIRFDKWADRGADEIFCNAFIRFDQLNSITGLV